MENCLIPCFSAHSRSALSLLTQAGSSYFGDVTQLMSSSTCVRQTDGFSSRVSAGSLATGVCGELCLPAFFAGAVNGVVASGLSLLVDCDCEGEMLARAAIWRLAREG